MSALLKLMTIVGPAFGRVPLIPCCTFAIHWVSFPDER